jgi:prefoldin subunit 5
MTDRQKINILNREINAMKAQIKSLTRSIEYYSYMKNKLNCVDISDRRITFTERL